MERTITGGLVRSQRLELVPIRRSATDVAQPLSEPVEALADGVRGPVVAERPPELLAANHLHAVVHVSEPLSHRAKPTRWDGRNRTRVLCQPETPDLQG